MKKREEIHPQTMVPGMPAYSNSENATRLWFCDMICMSCMYVGDQSLMP